MLDLRLLVMWQNTFRIITNFRPSNHTTMKNIISVIILALALITIQSCKTEEKMEAPVAAKKAKELTIHGDTRVDNYYWLRERENPEVIAYLEAENAYREEVMKGSGISGVFIPGNYWPY